MTAILTGDFVSPGFREGVVGESFNADNNPVDSSVNVKEGELVGGLNHHLENVKRIFSTMNLVHD